MLDSAALNIVYRSLEGIAFKNNILIRRFIANPNNWSRIINDDLSSFEELGESGQKGGPAEGMVRDSWNFMRGTLLMHDQEPLMYSSQKHIWDKFLFSRTMYDDRFLILHSEVNSSELDNFCRDHNAIPVYWFSNGALAYEWYDHCRFSLFPATDYRVIPLQFKFLCMNRLIGQQRIYRPILSSMLESTVDHDKLRLSCSLTDPYSKKHVLDCIENRQLPNDHMQLLGRFKDRSDTIMINIPDYETELKKRDVATGNDFSSKILTFHFLRTFCHIATETMFYDDAIHLTEKSFRAFVNMRPMILVGPAGSLAYLRKYGFKTFGDYWDESYDDEQDPHKRLDKIFDLIRELNKMSLKDMTQMLCDMEDTLLHNRSNFFNEFPNIIMKELHDNIDAAVNTFMMRQPDGWLLKRLSQMTKTEFADIKNTKNIPSENITSLEIYEDLQNGSREKQDAGIIRFLHQHLDLSDVDSAAEAINKIRQILD